MTRLWRNQRYLVLAFGVATALTLFFAVRAVLFALLWADPNHGMHPVEDWMTPRFIVHAYDLAPEQVAKALSLPVGSHPRLPLAELAHDQGVAPMVLVDRIEALIAARPNPAPKGAGQ
jgi:hypothetical protein